MSFGDELISETDRLHNFPELGRIVPEYRNDCIREIIFRPYRIVYRVNHDAKLCETARFGIRCEEYRNCNRTMPQKNRRIRGITLTLFCSQE